MGNMRDFDFASTPMRAKQKDLCKKNNSVKVETEREREKERERQVG